MTDALGNYPVMEARQVAEAQFKGLDADGDGFLTREEVLAGWSRIGVDPPKEQVDSLMAADTDADGKVGLEEYVTYFRQVTEGSYGQVPPQPDSDGSDDTSDDTPDDTSATGRSTIQVTVKLETSSYPFEVNASMTVRQLKDKLAEATGDSSGTLKLIVDGRILRDEDTLESSGITDRHTLFATRV